MTKIQITKQENIYINHLKLPALIELLQEKVVTYGEDAEIRISAYGDDYDVYIAYQQEETDYEYNLRRNREASAALYRKKMYEELKKEFEDDH
jgi:hypothetical protein